MKFGKTLRRIFTGAIIFMIIAVLFFVVSNLFIIENGKKRIVPDQELMHLKADCILILGAGVWDGNRPSPMLADRLNEGIRLYKKDISAKILVSGDHGRKDYDEVNVMKKYLIDAGIPGEDIFMDHAGFSTYESMYRAKEVFEVEKTIVVTQEYHLYRALYICDRLGLEAYGSAAYPYVYPGAKMRTIREWLARDKDILTCFFKVKPTFLGEHINIHGNGNITNDKPL